MEKNYSYKILPELNLIVSFYQGDVVIKDFVALVRLFMKDPDYLITQNVLIDLKHCTGVAFRVDLLDFIQFMTNEVKLSKKVKTGMVVSSLNQEFLIKFYKGFGNIVSQDIEYFRRFEDYFQWMGFNPEERKLITDTLRSLYPTSKNPI
jgi:hypothetical protein